MQSARSTHTVSSIVFFCQVLFFSIKSNLVKSGSGPEHWSFEPDTERVGIRLRLGLKSRKLDCITSTDYYVRSTRLRRRGKTTLKGRGQSVDHEAYGLCS